jgi:GNAT superfamily N-acetyltransferase
VSTSAASLVVRPAAVEDVGRIRQLIVDLATYERSADQVRVTEEQLRTALFGPRPAAYALMAELDGRAIGFALYFVNFSTWEGTHGIYLEDLFVEPEHRGAGASRALLAALARLARDAGYARVEWSVLDWNQPSIDFYRRVGAVAMRDWTVFRLTGSALQQLAAAGQLPTG